MIASDAPKAWSFSALSSFETCPKQFWHFRIKRDVKDVGGDASKFGEHVHSTAKLYLTGKLKKLPLDLTYMTPIFDKYKAHKFDELMCEQQLAINADFEPTGWFDKDVYCRAIIDAAFVKDSVALLVDWKTGRMKDDNDATQLRLSAVLFMIHSPDVQAVVMRYVWLAHKGKETSFKMTRSDIPAVWNALAPRLKRYQEAHKRDDFPANPSGLCRKHCPVLSCPHNQRES